MSLWEVENELAEQGWVVLDLPDPAPVFAARNQLLAWLREHGLPNLESLETYHEHAADDGFHVALLYELAQHYWREQLGRAIIEKNLELFRGLAGADLLIQNCPYLRAVRPGHHADAAPLHRDTYYGASPYEVSVVIPFSAMGTSAALRAIRGSHLEPDSAYPFEQRVSPDVAVRSPKHQLGFPYAPRLLHPALQDRAEPIPLRLGQVVVFGLSLVHGGGVNDGDTTRFSTDLRLVNAMAPVETKRGVRADYFVPLCSSAVSRSARIYLNANLLHDA